jgi:hypothetical protein
MDAKTDIKLTSSEIGNLWATYMGDTATVCQFQYAIKICQDEQIRPILQYALELAQKHVQTMKDLFVKEEFPIPIGFIDADVNLTAPRLFSDTYLLAYTQHMAQLKMDTYAMALTHAIRKDIRAFFREAISSSMELLERSTDLMLSLGIYVRPPYIPFPNHVDFVERQGYLTGFLGPRRPLNATEIDQLFFSIHRNSLGEALLLGYSQVAQKQEVRDYMRRGVELGKKQNAIFTDLLVESDLPSPRIWASLVEASTVSPFSDKLMMFQVTLMNQAGFGYYARAQATSARRDLGSTYMRFMAETAQYAEDGANITIDNAWLEEPPHAPDRQQLANV